MTIPSQIRYVHYFEYLINNGWTQMPIRPANIMKIKLITVPKADLCFRLTCQDRAYISTEQQKPTPLKRDTPIYEFKFQKPLPVFDDVLIEFFHSKIQKVYISVYA